MYRVETPIGSVPAEGAIDVSGLNLEPETMKELLAVNPKEFKTEVARYRDALSIYKNKLPEYMNEELDRLDKAFK